MQLITLEFETHQENFYSITDKIQSALHKTIPPRFSGILHIYNPHTSCGLLISESFDHTAAEDLQNFLKHLAPNNLPFIQHTSEGSDDSPSHMKNLLLSPTLNLIIENGQLLLGQWQGIFLCEFRRGKYRRKLYLKVMKG